MGSDRLVMDGTTPAKVPEAVIAEIRSREREGAIELPPKVRLGDRVRVLRGPFRDHLAIYAGMSGRDRIAVLLRLLGGERRILLPRCERAKKRSAQPDEANFGGALAPLFGDGVESAAVVNGGTLPALFSALT
jgi:hypothetical protein